MSQTRHRSDQSLPPTGDLRSYLTVIRRREWTILILTLICVAVAMAYSFRLTPMYASETRVLVKPLDPNQVLQGYNYNFVVSMQTEQALVSSPAVADDAAQRAKDADLSGVEDGSVSSSVPANTTFLDISYSAPSATGAQIWSQAYAEAYVSQRQMQATQAYQSAISGYTKQRDILQQELTQTEAFLIDALPEDQPELQDKVKTLRGQIAVIEASLAQVPVPAGSSAQIIAPADLPGSPYTPNHIRDGVLALIVGLILGLGVAFIRERLDDRMAGREDFEEELGAPVLAIVPRVDKWRKRSATNLVARDQPKSGPAEAYRTVRTNLEFLAKQRGLRTISVTSPSVSEGKTTTTANLAVALAETGRRVIAVSCDLRKPRLHRFFDVGNETGVTTALMEGRSVAEVAQRTGIDTLRIIASGPVPSNPAELLGSPEMEAFIDSLRSFADFILFDTAPVLAVSDTLVLVPQTDGTIVVVDASTTTRAALHAARDQLEQVGTSIVGGVFNDFDPKDAKTYPGYYRYQYYATSQYAEAEHRKIGQRNGRNGRNGGRRRGADAPHAPADEADIWG